MPQLDYDDQVEENPWRPVRMVLYMLWTIHFFICAFSTVGFLGESFVKTFDLQSVLMCLLMPTTAEITQCCYESDQHLDDRCIIRPTDAFIRHGPTRTSQCSAYAQYSMCDGRIIDAGDLCEIIARDVRTPRLLFLCHICVGAAS